MSVKRVQVDVLLIGLIWWA